MQFIKDFLKGAIIGTANIIPGVSGGTLALMLGIYERLISALRAISTRTLQTILQLFRLNRQGWEAFLAEMRRIDALFLITIGAGAAGAILLLSGLMTFLINEYHDPTYGFFFGLVAVSAFVPFRLIKRHTFTGLLAFIIALSGILFISCSMSSKEKLSNARAKYEIMMESEGTPIDKREQRADHGLPHLLFLFSVGAMAISAMILPGISGAFLLLIMGIYLEILQAVAFHDFLILAVFAAGCIFGILAFARLLNFLLRRWHDQTMSFLLGLIVGSLWAIWPFKTSAVIGGETIYLANRYPHAWGANETTTLATFLLGGFIVAVFVWFDARRRS